MRAFYMSAVALFLLGDADAQKQGMLGTTSTGELEVSVNIAKAAPQISISNLSNVNFNKTDGDSALGTQTVLACVYINQGGTYKVQVTADPLTSDDGQSYTYNLDVGQSFSDSESKILKVSTVPVTETINGMQSSAIQNCDGIVPRLELKFEDKGTDTVTAPFEASANVMITVIPD